MLLPVPAVRWVKWWAAAAAAASVLSLPSFLAPRPRRFSALLLLPATSTVRTGVASVPLIQTFRRPLYVTEKRSGAPAAQTLALLGLASESGSVRTAEPPPPLRRRRIWSALVGRET